MKCRRSKNSRGARLRGSAHAHPARKHVVPAAPAPGAQPARSTVTERVADARYCPVSELRVEGPSKGAIDFAGTVLVGPDGHVAGPVTARLIVVEGTVEGDLRGAEGVRLAASACVTGNVVAPRISVARGAKLVGRIATQRRLADAAAELDDPAVAELLTSA